MEGTLAEIRIFTGNYAPDNWMFCQGQILNISQNAPLYSLLGNTYGGDGARTFALPSLLGKSPAELEPSNPGGRGQYIICVNGYYPTRG